MPGRARQVDAAEAQQRQEPIWGWYLEPSLAGSLIRRCVHALRRPAQFAEETKRADRVVPWGIVLSVVGTAVLGFSYLLTLLFCIQARFRAPRPHRFFYWSST